MAVAVLPARPSEFSVQRVTMHDGRQTAASRDVSLTSICLRQSRLTGATTGSQPVEAGPLTHPDQNLNGYVRG